MLEIARFDVRRALNATTETGARVKLRQTSLPEEISDIQKRIKFIVHRMENAIANHEFEKARFYSDEERKERQNMRQLREKYNLDDTSTGIVTKDDIEDVVARWTGVPVSRLMEGEVEKLIHMEERLHERVVGQDEAVEAVANALRRARTGLQDPNRPIGSFVFLGPTGVGKTELARALADFLFDDERAMVRIDMSEYSEKHSVARLVGAPPGYVGYDEGGQLTEAVRRRPYCVILLDEIEKAHPEVFNILLQVLDDGRLTDGQGRTVDFTNTIIILTSNLGSQYLAGLGEEQDSSAVEPQVMEVVRSHFRPEFLNRLDEIILFHRLSASHMGPIVDIQVGRLTRLLEDRKIRLELTDAARAWLGRVGYDPAYGARPLKRAVQRYLQDPLADEILAGRVHDGSVVKVDEGDGGLAIVPD